MHNDQELQRKFASILPCLDERQRRLLAAAEARSLGYGGIRRVSRASGISHTAIRRALKQLDAPPPPAGRVRRPGGGRKKVRDKHPAILAALEELIDPETRGDPMSPLRWTCKSTRQLAEALARAGASPSATDGRRRVAPRPGLQPAGQPQDARRASSIPTATPSSRTSTRQVGRSSAAGQPVISVDTKKKELVGRLQERRAGSGSRQGEPERGAASTTSSTRSWARPSPTASTTWRGNAGLGQRGRRPRHGRVRRREHPPVVAARWAAGSIPRPTRLLITADGGGSNG